MFNWIHQRKYFTGPIDKNFMEKIIQIDKRILGLIHIGDRVTSKQIAVLPPFVFGVDLQHTS